MVTRSEHIECAPGSSVGSQSHNSPSHPCLPSNSAFLAEESCWPVKRRPSTWVSLQSDLKDQGTAPRGHHCGFVVPVPESFFWIHSLHALDALAAGSALAFAPQLCLPRGTQGVIQSNPKPPSGQAHTATATATVPQCRNPSNATLSVSDNSLCLLASCGLDPAATNHLIYDCFSKRRHCDLPGPSSASGNQALADTAAPYTPLANPPHSPRHIDHQHTKSLSFAPRHVYFRSSILQGHHRFQQL